LFIDDLQQEIDNARIVEPKCVARNVVTMHSRVRLLDRKRGQSEVYTLVYPEEANLEAGNLSVLSTLGTALLGARKGDVVQVAGAAGPHAIKIVSILYQPEAAGDAQQALAARRPSDSICSSCQAESLRLDR
jgi:regulator of nucleoside diphosphate kinase